MKKSLQRKIKKTKVMTISSVDGVSFKVLDKKIQNREFNLDDISFDVLLETTDGKKLFVIQHDIFQEWIRQDDKNLDKYLTKPKFDDIDSIYTELIEIGWSFQDGIKKYILSEVNENNINIISDYYNKENFTKI